MNKQSTKEWLIKAWHSLSSAKILYNANHYTDTISIEVHYSVVHLIPDPTMRNLKYMRQFAFSYPQKQIVQDLLAQLNWYQNLTIMQKIKDDNIRKWYASKTIENGWSQAILLHQIESGLYERSQSKKITNFNKTLVAPHSELVKETLKDPYIFDFLLLHEKLKTTEKSIRPLTHRLFRSFQDNKVTNINSKIKSSTEVMFNCKCLMLNDRKNNLEFKIYHSTLLMDVSGLIDDFGYKPDTKLAEGIGEFVGRYREFYNLRGMSK